MAAVQDPALAALRAKLVAECDANLPRGAARVCTLRTKPPPSVTAD
jgi:hypothetical protein